MDKEEFRAKQREINRLVDLKDYEGAMAVVDTIEWRKVKNVRTLSIVGEIYAANKRYEDSIDIFLMAYNRAGVGKNILYRLIEISLKIDQIDEAEEFFEEFEDVAPNDNNKYILKYKILKAKKASVDEMIEVLEEYKEREFTEKWAYELAKLYYKSGKKEQCIDLCDTMILWFSEGPYVLKALDLKNRLGVLGGVEKDQYEQQFDQGLYSEDDREILQEKEEQREIVQENPEVQYSYAEEEDEKTVVRKKESKGEDAGLSFQEKLTRGFKDIFKGRKKEKNENDLFSDDLVEEAEEKESLNIKHSNQEEDENAPRLEPESLVDLREFEESAILEKYGKLPEEEEAERELSENTDESEELEEEKEPEEFIFRQPENPQIPPSMQNTSFPDPDIIREIMDERKKAQEEAAASEEEERKLQQAEPAFNLEETILAAAFAQGIDLGEKKEEVKNEEVILPLESEGDIEKIQPGLAETPVTLEEKEEERSHIGDFFRKAGKQLLIAEEPEETELEEETQVEPEEVEFEEETEVGPEEVELEEETEIEPEEVEFEEETEVGPEEVELEEETEVGPEEVELEEETEIEAEEVELEEETEVEPEEDSLDVLFENAVKASASNLLLHEEMEEASENTIEEMLDMAESEEISEKSDDSTEEIDLTKIIPRKRELTEEEEMLFSYFVKVPGMKEQIVDMLCDVQESAADKTSNTGNIVVMGGGETGKTQLISKIIPAICKELYMEATKVAYVYADQLNGKDMAKIVSKMAGGFLVIENISLIDAETVEKLNKAMEFRTDGLTVILEDEKTGMRNFLEQYPDFARKFTSVINIPVFTNDELVDFANVYTQENGFFIDQTGTVALYNWIGENQRFDEPMTIGTVKEMLDNVIQKNRGRIGFKMLRKKKNEVDGLVPLSDKDFN